MFGKNKKQKSIPALPPIEEEDYEEEVEGGEMDEEVVKPKKQYKPLPKLDDLPEIEPPTSEEGEDDIEEDEFGIPEEEEIEKPSKEEEESNIRIITNDQLLNMKIDNLSKMVESIYPMIKLVADRIVEVQKKKTTKKK